MGQPDNLCLIAEDLGNRRLADVLKANESWDPSAGTVIVAEGLVMYLSLEAVRDLFRQCAAVAGAGSRIPFPISLPARTVRLTPVDGPV